MSQQKCACAVCHCQRETFAIFGYEAGRICIACDASRHAPNRKTGLTAYLMQHTGYTQTNAFGIAKLVDDWQREYPDEPIIP